MNDVSKGWLAGIIDGEGSIILEKTGSGWRHPAITVVSTDYAILEKCKKVANGGSINKKKVYDTIRKPSWMWRMGGGNKVLNILRLIEPYLICPNKKTRANYLIDGYLQHTVRYGRYSEEQKNAKLEFERIFFTL